MKKGPTKHVQISNIINHKKPELRTLFFTNITRIIPDKIDMQQNRNRNKLREAQGQEQKNDFKDLVPSPTTN